MRRRAPVSLRPGRSACLASWASLAPLVALGVGACDAGAVGDSVTSIGSPIFGGTVDPTDEAVMALVQQVGTAASVNSTACTGTTIAKVGVSGIFVTAGHCVVANDGMGHLTLPIKVAAPTDLYVLPGADWAKSAAASQYFGVAQVAVDPGYDGMVDSPFDVALVRYLGATASMPVIPALAPADDTLAINSTVTLVGYGKTETNAMNSQRRKVDRVLSMLSARQLEYSQTDLKGACEGDSGGPALFQTPNGVRVAGVTSFGDPACTMVGVSLRLSPAASFIQSFIASVPTTLSCGDCTAAAVGPGNVCFDQGATCANPTTSCGAFLDCLGRCQTSTCAAQCRNTMSAGAALYDALARCQCGGMCATPCKQDQACAAFSTSPPPPPPPSMCGGLTDSRPACASCITNTCCVEAAACAADPSCASCQQRATPTCRFYPPFSALNTCLATCVGAPCAAPATTADAGSGPSDGLADKLVAAPHSGCDCAVAGPRSNPASPWETSALGTLGMTLLFFRRRAGRSERRH
jgi:hypothetical protein